METTRLLLIIFIAMVLLVTCQGLDRVVIRRSILNQLNSLSSQEVKVRVRRQVQIDFLSDDEDLENSSTESSGNIYEEVEGISELRPNDFGWRRTKINLRDSVQYSDELQDYQSDLTHKLSGKLMILMENYLKLQLQAYVEATPLMFSLEDNDVIATVDVGICGYLDQSLLEPALLAMLRKGELGNFKVSEKGFRIVTLGPDRNRPDCYTRTTYTPKEFSPTTTTASNTLDVLLQLTRTTTKARVKPTSTTPLYAGPSACRLDQATCRNLECIDRRLICDGHADCSDGSDETEVCQGTNQERLCAPEEFLCNGTNECKQKIWRCDGDQDCSNGFDELNCPPNDPRSICPSTNFQCVADGNCIPKSYLCDSEEDCSDGSDEKGCSEPRVVQPPNRFVNATLGSTVRLECRADGFPTPVITWRVNWNNVPSPPRVSMTSENGFGTLIIRNVQYTDQGAYSCQAMNIMKMKLAVPDAILKIVGDDCESGSYRVQTIDGESICKPCYCSGVTDVCRAGSKQYQPIVADFNSPEDKQNVSLKPINYERESSRKSPVNKNQIKVNPGSNEVQLIDLSKRFLAAYHHWSLPAQFLGSKIESYGGTLKYSYSYNLTTRGEPRPIIAPDVILEGKNKKQLRYSSDGPFPEPGKKNSISVVLDEKYWKTKDGVEATKEDMVEVLGSLNNIFIRTIYDENMSSTGIGGIRMEAANKNSQSAASGGRQASYVEVCQCPEAYSGDSCEECSTNYIRDESGSCVPNFAIRECPNGLIGENCDQCPEGFVKYDDGCTQYPTVICDRAGTQSKNVNGSCNCKTGCELADCSGCKPGYFYLSEENPEGCIPCYCSGVSESCDSSNLHWGQVSPYYTSQSIAIVNLNDDTIGDFTGRVVAVKQTRNSQPSITVSLESRDSGYSYWSLRDNFIGSLLSSYGGLVTFTTKFMRSNGGSRRARNQRFQVDQPILVLKGNGKTLYYNDDAPVRFGVNNQYSVEIIEQNWKMNSGYQPTRKDFMKVLSSVDYFLILASYSGEPISTTLSDVEMQTAVAQNTGGMRSYQVEECKCPEGYTGLSCEMCDEGFLAQQQEGSQICIKFATCNCNGHSETCDQVTGICSNCRDNTAGDHCEQCADGYYLYRYTNVCFPCPCGDSNIPCSLDRFNQPLCEYCPDGYVGDQCERCDDGYQFDETYQDPNRVVCIPAVDTKCQCPGDGYYTGDCDEQGRCICVTEPDCIDCERKEYAISVENPNGNGCIPCFCMGITRDCSAARMERVQIISDFIKDRNFSKSFKFRLTDSENRAFEEYAPIVAADYRGASFRNVPSELDVFFSLNKEFLGDKVTSYGGSLSFTLASDLPPGLKKDRSRPIVIIRGNGYEFVTKRVKKVNDELDKKPGQNTYMTYFKLNKWIPYKGPERNLTREELLMALANLDSILIKPRYSRTQYDFSVVRVVMEAAAKSDYRLENTFEVEDCQCPDGYEGFSCEGCAPGYTRNYTGAYLGYCQKCECNGHSSECESETGACYNCEHNTIGQNCEFCAPGFYRHNNQNENDPCLPCPCPQLSERPDEIIGCKVDSEGDFVCNQCPQYSSGKMCEDCIEGYARFGGSQQCIKKTEIDDSPPTVRVYPENVQLQTDEQMTLTCEFDSRYSVDLSWRRIKPNGRRTRLPSSSTVSRDGTKLYLRDFKPEDAGNYECVASNLFGTSHATAVIFSGNTSPISALIQPNMVHVNVGEDVEFYCQVTGDSPTIKWTSRQSSLPANAVSNGPRLSFRRVRMSNYGLYMCTATDRSGQRARAAAHLIVSDQDQNLSVEVTPAQQEVKEGESAMFECLIQGSPKPTIEWRRADGKALSSIATVNDNFLLIPTTSRDDRSTYLCSASNEYGTFEATGELEVTVVAEPLSVSIEPASPLELYVGDSRTVRCLSPGKPLPHFEWIKAESNGRLADNVQQGGSYLRFLKVTAENEGVYTCTARNDYFEASTDLTVIVRNRVRKPLCTTPLKEVNYYVGMNSTIKCDVGGEPIPVVTWEGENGTSLDDNMVVEGNNLIIVNVSLSNIGTYTCVATNLYGTSKSHVKVNVEQKDLPKIQIQPGLVLEYEVGETATLLCLTDQEDTKVRWERLDDKNFTDSTYSKEEGGMLTIESVQAESRGRYRCIARNEVGHSFATVTISVVEKPQITIIPSEYVDLREGDELVLKCTSSGQPRPSVVWEKQSDDDIDRISMKLTKYRKGHIQYTKNNVGKEDAGVYTCTSTNSIGISRKNVVVRVHAKVVMKPPTIFLNGNTLKYAEVKVIPGKTVSLECLAKGEPNPEITWHRYDSEFPEGVNNKGSVLEITDFQRQYNGNYTCKAENAVGEDYFIYNISIIEPPVVKIFSSPVIELKQKASITIDCKLIKGAPNTIVKWHKNGEDIDFTISSGTFSLKITDFNPELDIGRYTCSAENEAGFSSAFIDVDEEPFLLVSPSKQVIRVGETAKLTCVVIKNGAAIQGFQTVWLKNTSQEWFSERMSIQGEELKIENVKLSDEGVYRCAASNAVGIKEKTSTLIVQDVPKVTIYLSERNEYRVGESLKITCSATGSPSPTTVLRKDDEELFVSNKTDTHYIVDSLTAEDSGLYTCISSNEISVAKASAELNVKKKVEESIRHKIRSGRSLELQCGDLSLDSVSYQWYKVDESDPVKESIPNSPLAKRFYLKDTGSYECRSDDDEVLKRFVVDVEAEIPLFTQTLISYATAMVPNTDILYRSFYIKISFKTTSLHAILLYMDSEMDIDFFSVSINKGIVEFRFNAGSGTFLAQSKKSIKLHRWHTVQVSREYENGWLQLDDGDKIEGTAPGGYRGVDLDGDLYIGGVPEDKVLHNDIAFMRPHTGFFGCISQLNFSAFNSLVDFQSPTMMTSKVGIFSCKACRRENQCKNDGECFQTVETQAGYKCNCREGFVGNQCQYNETLYCPESCNENGDCVETKDGFECNCYAGFKGPACSISLPYVPSTATIATTEKISLDDFNLISNEVLNDKYNEEQLYQRLSEPASSLPALSKNQFFRRGLSFNGNGYAVSAPNTKPEKQRKTELTIRLRRSTDDDGVIFYQSGKTPGSFISVSVVGGAIEFKFSFGSDVALVQSSAKSIGVGSWHTIHCIRKKRKGSLYVDGKLSGRGKISSKSDNLLLDGKLYVGGVPTPQSFPGLNPQTTGFNGCLEGLRIDDFVFSLKSTFELVEAESCEKIYRNPTLHGLKGNYSN